MKISKKLRSLRMENHFTLKDLSDKSGLSVSFISDIENERRNPSIEKLQDLADALGVSINEFFDGNNTSKEKIDKYTKKELPVIPSEFTNPDEARAYIEKHQIFGANGFNSDKLTDDEILEFANELLKQMELISFKYKK